MRDMLNSIVPISRFNKGEASKIFEEVNKTGYKIVVKNNKPACVLITPKQYQKMVETIEDYELMIETEKRLKNENNMECYSMEDVMKQHGIRQEELDNIQDVEKCT
ncbi:type II toxin-antitoxin system prevent-host-death family antitoxin [Clostridium sp. WILCCON 0269]|uniref:Antitoxin n=1 Tax=Candidatus Clostridium eludens TaxID=3381663 RepID=A0ABW8SRL1_9CLOT